ncbi:immunoglobulin superfamily member 5 [Micropterus salmoides]|uniref:immunoglobulin superfamily member 5 n=1 Tax=Micropterus salmoides TaxID=27706 RepID=UPI0018ED3805|nr:immunoglobulin superfamily member 5 [Micropterus salmoides]
MLSASWTSWPNLFCIHLLLCATGAVSEKFQLAPLNSTVLQGSDVRFNATVQGVMQIMTWTVRGNLVLTVANSSVTTSSNQFSARIYSSGDINCVEFTIHKVTCRESGPVVCAVLGEYGSKTAQLYVQGNVTTYQAAVTLTEPQSSSVFLVVVPKPTDWTVLIAVVVSIGGFALLVLLILGIIFCYKRRKEKQLNYQDEMSRRARTQSQISGVNAAGQRQGQVNTGYVPEGQTSVAPSELTDSGFGQANGSSVFEMHGVVTSNQAVNSYSGADNTVDKSGFKKHRHVTIV